MRSPADVRVILRQLPIGTFRGSAEGRRYVVSHSIFNAGRSRKIVAEELGGPDYISLNFYEITSGAQLYPCEMAAEKVIQFLRALKPDTAHPR